MRFILINNQCMDVSTIHNPEQKKADYRHYLRNETIS